MCEAAPRLLWIRKVAEDVLSSGRCVTQVTVYYITHKYITSNPGTGTGSTGTKCRRRKRQKTQLKTKNTPPAMLMYKN